MYKGASVRLSADLSAENLQARRDNIFRVLKEKKKTKNLTTKDAVSEKTIFQNEGEIEIFPEKQKLREFTTSRRVL